MTVYVRLAADGDVGPASPSSDPSRFEEAVEAWRRKVPVTDAEWDTLSESSRQRAFAVADVADLELLSDVWNALDAAIAKGAAFTEFKGEIGDRLEEAWGGDEPWHLETIFRTNVQTAYNAGRYAQQTNPSVLKRRPFWKFSAVMDRRTSAYCSPLNGTVVAANDPWWNTRQPPLHFNCRSTVISLTAAEAEDVEVDAFAAPELEGMPGFGTPPSLTAWTPDVSGAPEPLRAAYERRKAS